MSHLIETVYNLLWGDLFTLPVGGGIGISLMAVLLLTAGVFFTLRTRLLPVRLFRDMIAAVCEKNQSMDSLSSFQTLIVSTATRVGMGNLVGVVAAVSAGGAGAVFWMWVTALLGASTSFVESTLAQKYRQPDPLYGGQRGGGISHRADGKGLFEISGDPVIVGNYRGGEKNSDGSITGGTTDNVGLTTSGKAKNFITIVGPMKTGAEVWVNIVTKLDTQTEIDAENNVHTYLHAGSYRVTADDVAHFNIDDGGEKFFKLTENNGAQKIIIALPEAGTTQYTVTVNLGKNMTSQSGIGTTLTRTVDANKTMEPILCEAAEGYYFPETYTVAETSGISVMRNANGHQIMVSGTPTANVTITLPDAVADPDYKQDDNKPVNPKPGHTTSGGSTVTGSTVTSAKTFDTGVAAYGVTALLSLSGMAWLGRKRED